MLSVVIGCKPQVIIDVTGLRFRTYPLFCRRDGGLQYLNACESLGDVGAVEFWLMRRRWWRTEIFPLPLPQNLESAIKTFLAQYHAKQDISFDCYSFASLVNGVALDDKRYLSRRFRCEPREAGNIAPGETVFLFGGIGCHFKHAAVYLGEDRFLSVWGGGGDLEVASFEQMRIGFNTTKAYAAFPRSQE